MKLYKDWKIQNKILVASAIPFLLAVIICVPFVIHKIIQNIEENTKNYLSEVAYRTSIEIKYEVEKLISQVHVLANTLDTLIKEDNYDRQLIESVFRDVSQKNSYLTRVWSIWENQSFHSEIKAIDTFSLTGKYVLSWGNELNNNLPNLFQDHNLIFQENFYQTTHPFDNKVMMSSYNVDTANPNNLVISIYKPIFDKSGNLATIVGIDIAFNEFKSFIDGLKEYGITHAALILEDKIVQQYAQNAKIDYHNDIELWKKIKPLMISDQEYLTDRFDEDLRQYTFTVVEPMQITELDKVWGLIVDLPRDPIVSIVYQNAFVILIFIGACLTTGILVSIITARNIATPISSISAALKYISLGKHETEIPIIRSGDEIGQMTDAAIIFKKNALDLAEAKQHAEKANLAKSEFLNNISHELRTPMHAILSYSKLALEKVKGDETKLSKYISNIIVSSERILRLVNDLLDISKLEAGKTEFTFKRADLMKCIKSVQSEIKSLLAAKKLDFRIDNQTKNSEFIFDHEKITQVLINIISNAIKFSSAKSPITLQLKDTFIDNNQPAIFIALEDQGIGVPKGDLETIFDKFTQSQSAKNLNEGTGLGLSIAKQIVKAHGGRIWAENSPTNGTIIKIILPHDPTVKSKEMNYEK